MEQWGSDRAADLTALVAAAMTGEELSLDELLSVCWEDPGPDRPDEAGVVLATPSGDGAVVVVIRSVGVAPDAVLLAFVKLVVVHPDARRHGLGHALMEAAEQWAWAEGATELHLSGSAPFYLWPGVDATATEMACLAESRGYRLTGSDINMALPTSFRGPAPDGVTIRRVMDDVDIVLLDRLLHAQWPEWIPETHRAIEQGCCLAAFVPDPDGDGPLRTADPGPDDVAERVIGFACHSVNRAGWLGPMGTDPDRRTGGIGNALLGQVCRDLMIAEFSHTEISWVGPIRFYAKAGATVSRVFRQYRKRRPRDL